MVWLNRVCEKIELPNEQTDASSEGGQEEQRELWQKTQEVTEDKASGLRELELKLTGTRD